MKNKMGQDCLHLYDKMKIQFKRGSKTHDLLFKYSITRTSCSISFFVKYNS